MPPEDVVLDIAGLLADAVVLCEALLAGDLVEARFRARLVAGNARVLGLDDVQVSAAAVGLFLGAVGKAPLPGYAQAAFQLSEHLQQALSFLPT